MPHNQRRASEDSVEDLEEEEKHHALPHNHQMFLQNYSFNNAGGGGLHAGFSVDDGGMDEYDVADERAHLFEYINPDNMTYEEILALQERIGYVNKGLSRERITSFPRMRKKDLSKYLDKKKERQIKKSKPNLEEVKIVNPVEELKLNRNRVSATGEDECDEIVDGDEGIVNRRLPLNSYNHQVPKAGDNNEEEDGWENCKEEDEERKDGEMIGQSIKRKVLQDKEDEVVEDLHQSQIISVSSTNKERCAICFEGIRNIDYIKLLPCSHHYHSDCIDQWLMVEKRCPMCMAYLEE